jgi:peptidoglycan/LPS O-acetylase OafA/YrhL
MAVPQPRPTVERAPTRQKSRGDSVRLEIQALRALAVVLVIVYHYWPGIVRGGFVGVDVFFVVSGFLITAHLMRPTGGRGFGPVLAFWARRARRILPAALLVLAASAIGVFAVVPRSLWSQFFSEIAGSALYVQNWLLNSEAVHYLTANDTASPVQNYWSLSVEEQFYLAWPLIVLGTLAIVAFRRPDARRRTVVLVLGAIGVASLVYCVYLTSSEPSLAYFSTFTRAWEFAAGGVLAVISPSVPAGLLRIRSIVSWIGLAMVVGSALVFTGATPFPGFAALAPVIGAAAVIWAGMPDARFAPSWFLGLRPIQFVGDISYSLYLWHFPLIVLAGYAFLTRDGLPLKLSVLGLTVVLAVLTKRFVEDPARRAPVLVSARPRRTYLLGVAGMAVVVAIAGSGWDVEQGDIASSAARAQALVRAAPSCFGAAALAPGSKCAISHQTPYSQIVPMVDAVPAQAGTCLLETNQFVVRNECDHPVSGATQTWALIGDSHAGALAPAIEIIARAQHANLEIFDKAHCPLIEVPDPTRASNPTLASTCSKWNLGIDEYLGDHPDITKLIVTGSAAVHEYLPSHEANQVAVLTSGYLSAWGRLPSSIDSIVVVKDVPRQAQDPISCIDAHRADYLRVCSTPRIDALFDDPLEDAAKERVDKRVSLVDVSNYLCTATTCPVVVGGALVNKDVQHIANTFAVTLAPYIAAQMK